MHEILELFSNNGWVLMSLCLAEVFIFGWLGYAHGYRAGRKTAHEGSDILDVPLNANESVEHFLAKYGWYEIAEAKGPHGVYWRRYWGHPDFKIKRIKGGWLMYRENTKWHAKSHVMDDQVMAEWLDIIVRCWSENLAAEERQNRNKVKPD